ncbi:MAG: hypothetical protein AAGC55_10615, partial [Myxococcota bacterium]
MTRESQVIPDYHHTGRHPGRWPTRPLGAVGSGVLAAFLALGACSGDDGSNGSDGLGALVDTSPEPAGDNCPLGGTAIVSGIDTDRDGQLDDDEITSEAFVCTGESGVNGDSTLIDVLEEPPGANCAFGGVRVNAGIDADRDGELSEDEITDVEYICAERGDSLSEV